MWNFVRIIAVLALLIAINGLLTPVAEAHGRFPRANGIIFDPDDSAHFVVRTTFGGLVTRDGGQTYDWFCRSLSKLTSTEDPTMVILEGGSLLTASFSGMSRTSSLHCDWDFPSEDLTSVVVIDVERHPSMAQVAFAVTSSGGVANLVYRTADSGLTWTPTSAPIDTILFERIRVAPSNPDIVYLSGAFPPTDSTPRRPFVHRSMDGGATWENFAFELKEGDRNIFMEAVDPTNPNKLYMLVRHRSDSDTFDRIVVSEDAGETFEEIFTAPIITGLVLSDDGTEVWITAQRPGFLLGAEPKDPYAGLWYKNGDAEFEHLRDDLSLSCISREGDVLWICAENYEDGFAVARTTDNGATFGSKLLLEDIRGQLQCSPDTLSETCQFDFEDFDRDVLNPITSSDAGVDAGEDATVDMGVDAGAIPMTGCNCGVSSRSPDYPVSLLLIVMGLTFGHRRY